MEEREFRRLQAVESIAAEAAELIARFIAEREVSRAELVRKRGWRSTWSTKEAKESSDAATTTRQ